MIFILASFAFWFAQLSSLPQVLCVWSFSKLSHLSDALINILIKLPNRVLECTKCLSFWIGVIYFWNESRHVGTTILMAGVTSLLGIVFSRIYNKYLSV